MPFNPVNRFRGLNNVAEPLTLDWRWQTRADNVDVTDEGVLTRAQGYTRRTTNSAISGAYATIDMQRFYVVDAGELRRYDSGLGTYAVLRSALLASVPTYFAEINGVVYFTNGTDYGSVTDAGARPWGVPIPGAPALTAQPGILDAGRYRVTCTFVDAWGVESGNGPIVAIDLPDASSIAIDAPQDANYTTNVYVTRSNNTVFYLLGGSSGVYNHRPNMLGSELPFWMAEPPRGNLPCVFQGRMYLGEAVPSQDLSALWVSLPLEYHHFVLAEGLAVPGSVRMLAATSEAMLIGTERGIYGYADGALHLLAPYGVTPGVHACLHRDRLYFWTLRGLARAMPYELLTEATLSVAPGASAAALVIERDGMRRYVVALQRGGVAFNPA